MAIWIVLRRRADLPRRARRVALLVVVLLVAAAGMHLAEMVTLWVPAYGMLALLKAFTAATAIIAAVLIWPQIPQLLALPSPRDLARANLALVQANASLETAVAWRTHEIERAKQRFEQALSRSNITVFTQDTDLRYTWIYNPRPGLSAGRHRAHFAGNQPVRGGGRIADAATQGARARPDHQRHRRGARREGGPALSRYDRQPDLRPYGAIDGVLCTAVDVTEKRLFEVRLASMAAQLGAAYRRLELALENSAITVFEQDADLHYTYMHNPPAGTGPEDYLGRNDAELFPEADQRKLVPPKQRVLDDGRARERRVRDRDRRHDALFRPALEANTDAAGNVLGVIGTASI